MSSSTRWLWPLSSALTLALTLALGALSCGEDRVGPIPAVVVGYSGPHRLGLVDVELRTLYDLDTLDGQAGRFYGGAHLVVDLGDLQAEEERALVMGQEPDAEAIARQILRAPGAPVQLFWTEDDGQVLPLDYDSLAMLSAYYHLEGTWLWLTSLGQDLGALEGATIYYRPSLVDETETLAPLPLLDNAAYFSPSRSLILLGNQDLDGTPLAMNPGVLVHEFSHALFDLLVFEQRGFAVQAGGGLSQEASQLLRAFDEGGADYLAAARTLDPDFLALSLPGAAQDRNLALDWRLSPELTAQLGSPGFDPYRLGSVWASALWEIGQQLGHDWTTRQLLLCLGDLRTRAPQMSLTLLPDLLANRAGRHRDRVCGTLRTHFEGADWAPDSACLNVESPEAGQ